MKSYLLFCLVVLTTTFAHGAKLKTNGIELHYIEAGTPGGELTLFLHGFPEYSEGWSMYLKKLSYMFPEKHFVALDMRGYNLSDTPTEGCDTSKPTFCPHYSHDKITGDVIGAIEALSQGQVHLVGHDWGAYIAVQTTLARPDLIKKLYVINGTHPYMFNKEYLNIASEQFRMSYYMRDIISGALTPNMYAKNDFEFFRLALFHLPSFDKKKKANYLRQWNMEHRIWAQMQYYASLQISEEAFLNPDPILDGLKQLVVTVPTVLIWGYKDKYLSKGLLKHRKEVFTDLSFHPIYHAGHFVQHEAFWQVLSILGKNIGQ